MFRQFFTSAPFWLNGLVLVRIFTGMLIMKYGKVLFSSSEMQGQFDFFENVIKFPAPYFLAYLAKGTEFFGGLFLALGLFTRLASLMLATTMFVATFIANNGKFWSDAEVSFMYMLLFLVFFFAGPGKWSLDYLLFDRKNNNL
ncbi:DoxX family protein [Rhodocytophaga aerolata]|uniref:DoxX family protein n=1 Tax=Rhodocytophaga aerolata TaxID=455078 RepID=A0ABT8R4F0_9BACT|nr:DoxX family protein [Rhodocytophaga aerolata]MDO1446958.1 DoxX family protein [Rhodocytophaga aerolata]